MKKSIALVFALILIVITVPVFAAPSQTFAVLPADHWAYQAVNELVRVGIIDGYDNKSPKGDKTMSRYEMAQLVSKAMANSEKATAKQKALIDKLAIEFALELNNIAPRTDREKDQPTFKFSGSYSVQYKVTELSGKPTLIAPTDIFRLNGLVKVSKDTFLNFRLTNWGPTNTNFKDSTLRNLGDATPVTQLDRYWVATKVGSTNASLGRQPLIFDDSIIDSGFFSFDGLNLKWDVSNFTVDIKYGRFARNVNGYIFDNHTATEMSNINICSLRIDGKKGDIDWGAGVIKLYNPLDVDNGKLANYVEGRVGWQAQDKLYLAVDFMKNTEATTGGGFWTSKLVYGDQVLDKAGKSNITVRYMRAQQNGQLTTFSVNDGNINWGTSDAFINRDIAYKYAFDKNLNVRIQRGWTTDLGHNDTAQDYSMWRCSVNYLF